MWRQIISAIQNHQRFVLTSHINPDCDALGSELALAEFLESLGKRPTIINSDGIAAMYKFLDPKHRIKRYSPKRHMALIRDAEVIVVLDASGGWDRLGQIGKALAESSAVKLCIDHHPDSTNFVDVAVVDTDAAATGELIFDLVNEMGGVCSRRMAQALYAAILTDTGSFRFPKTSPRTHTITAALLEAGADPQFLYRRIYEQNSLGVIHLKGHIMASIQTAAEGQIAYYNLKLATLKQFGATTADMDGVASFGQRIGGVRISVFCAEATQGRVKISLRSDGSISINRIAAAYGGGGHPSAAGALVTGKVADVTADVVAQVEQLLAAECH